MKCNRITNYYNHYLSSISEREPTKNKMCWFATPKSIIAYYLFVQHRKEDANRLNKMKQIIKIEANQIIKTNILAYTIYFLHFVVVVVALLAFYF